MKQVLIMLPADPAHKKILEQAASGTKEELSLAFCEHPSGEMIRQADVIVGTPDAEAVRGAGHLALLQSAFSGTDAYQKPGVLPDGAILCSASGAYGVTVSEHMVAMTFALTRHFGEYIRNQASHVWKEMGEVRSIEDSTVLVLGLGDIGSRYAKKMKALGAAVIGVRRTRKEKPDYLDEQYTMDQLDALLPRADYVAMVLPGGPATEHVMDERRLRLMKKGAFLINCGRGNAVDPKALRKVLSEGLLGGAALDVTEPEPLPEDDPLWDFPNVIITPHVAGKFLMQSTYEKVVAIAAENLRRFGSGEPLTHVVDRKAGY